MAYSCDLSKMAIMDYFCLSWTIMEWTIMDYHGLSWTIMDIMDYHGVLWTIVDYHGLSETILDNFIMDFFPLLLKAYLRNWKKGKIKLRFVYCVSNWLLCRSKRSPGHLGCSLGYNSNLYKPYLHDHYNSQGREQVHR